MLDAEDEAMYDHIAAASAQAVVKFLTVSRPHGPAITILDSASTRRIIEAAIRQTITETRLYLEVKN